MGGQIHSSGINRSINSFMLITQDTNKKTRNLELGGGLEAGVGRDDVIAIEELEEHVPAKGGRTHRGLSHEDRSVL